MVAAAVLLLGFRRRFRAGMVGLAAATALYGPWVFWQGMQGLPEEPLQLYYSAASYRTWWAWRVGNLAEGAWVVLLNFLLTLAAPAQAAGIRNAALAVATGSVVWIAAAMAWRRCGRPVLPLLVSTVGMVTLLLVWTWLPGRMLLATVPLLFVLIACGSNSGRFQPIVAAAALLYCAAGLVNAAAATWMSHRDAGRTAGDLSRRQAAGCAHLWSARPTPGDRDGNGRPSEKEQHRLPGTHPAAGLRRIPPLPRTGRHVAERLPRLGRAGSST